MQNQWITKPHMKCPNEAGQAVKSLETDLHAVASGETGLRADGDIFGDTHRYFK